MLSRPKRFVSKWLIDFIGNLATGHPAAVLAEGFR